MVKSSAEFRRTAEKLNYWLGTLDLEDAHEIDVEELGDALMNLNELAWAGGPRSRVCREVIRARRAGCDWNPIAVALGLPRQQVRVQFTDAMQ